MDANELLAKASKRFSLKDVQDNQVETVSVLSIEELDSLIATAVQQQASKQMAELAASGGGDGGLEQAAAEAALEAEAKALEEKAEAEQRAATAESKVAQLEAKIAELEENAGDPEAAAKVTELEGKVSELEATLAAQATELEAAKKAAAAAADDDVDAGGEVTDSDRTQAQRIAEAFLEDVFSDDEDKTNSAIKDGTFREAFAEPLKRAHRKYVKRIKAHVRADKDWWETTISKFLLKDW